MMALTMLLFWLMTDARFRVSEANVTITGVRLGDASAVRAHISGIARLPNVFRVRAGDIVRDLGGLPEVRFARASVTLPADVTIDVVERRPIFIWSNGGDEWFVDDSGVLFSPRDAAEVTVAAQRGVGETTEPSEGGAGAALAQDTEAASADDRAGASTERATPTDAESAANADGGLADAESATGAESAADEQPADLYASLPLLEDARIVERAFVSGDRLPAIDFAVMRQLLGVTPELLGSRAEDISLRIDQGDGYVLQSDDLGWQAVFGHYRATIQPPDDVPRQVQCLRSLFASRAEHKVARVRLVVSGGLCGTFRMAGSKRTGA
jgi:hypothetical protein